MFYVICNDNLLISNDKETLKDYGTVLTLPEDYEEGKYIVVDGVLVLNPNYDEEETLKRELNFKSEFFEVQNYGWYRRIPKGYSSAVESMNVLFNIASVTQGIQAGLIIFYEEPDFSDPEQCTEEWLVEHQIIMPAMTLQEFMQLYIAFMTAWNAQEHERAINYSTPITLKEGE